MSGGSFGDFAESFLHGFTVPFKKIGNIFDLIIPGSGTIVNTLANVIDESVPGARYASMSDVFKGKKIAGSGRGRGRPKKIQVEPPVMVVKKARGRPRKSP